MTQQPHTEASIAHTDGEQNTGNHKLPGQPDTGGADRLGGTRAGAENVERDSRAESVETGTDLDKVSGLDEAGTSTKKVGDPKERRPERDEHGRL